MNPAGEQQKMELKEAEAAADIFRSARKELCLDMRYLEVPLHSLGLMPDPKIRGLAADGSTLYYHSGWILDQFLRDPVLVNRSLLHVVFHCLFCHLFLPAGEPEKRWDLACDLAVEYAMDQLPARSVRIRPGVLRRETYRKLNSGGEVLTPAMVFRQLSEAALSPEAEERLAAEFRVDDHRLWREPKVMRQRQQNHRQWQDMAQTMETEIELFSREAGEGSKGLAEQLRVEQRQKYSYRQFLKKFAVLREEMGVDPDSFDYIFYCYGLEHYGNMPLIEPQETRERARVEDFVIALDTSLSCSGELIRRFLEETYSILNDQENFFRKIHLHILQCDEEIQQDTVIRSPQEMREYMEHFTVRGQGGTDFRPVFGYVNELLRKKNFTRLKGLIYFTDGRGIYPARRPLYETAFVFLEEDYQDIDVPPWALKLILGPEDIMREERVHEHQESQTGDQGYSGGVSSEK